MFQNTAFSSDNESELSKPNSGRGHATGILLHKNIPKNGLPVYLVLHTNEEEFIEIVSEPKAYTNNSGRWNILNLKPGFYSIMATIPDGVFFIPSKSIFKIRDGEITDFGVLDYKGKLNHN